jgi:hypothetical protein
MNAAIERAGMQAEYADPARVGQLLQHEHAIVTKLAEAVDLGS